MSGMETLSSILLKEEVLTDSAEIVKIYGQGCTHSTGVGVSGFQVDFDVRVKNNLGESREFHIVYQEDDRSDNMKAYCGFEMQKAANLGYDADESCEMSDFLDYSSECESFFFLLNERAEDLCCEFLAEAKGCL